MEIKTAIEELETLKALYEFVESVDMSKPVGAIDIAIRLLGKQVAIRPVACDNGSVEYHEEWAECPKCSESIPEYVTENETKCYCLGCGQRLDWGREVETKPYTEKDTCVCCGKYVPEGRMVCQECEERNYNGREPWNK